HLAIGGAEGLHQDREAALRQGQIRVDQSREVEFATGQVKHAGRVKVHHRGAELPRDAVVAVREYLRGGAEENGTGLDVERSDAPHKPAGGEIHAAAWAREPVVDAGVGLGVERGGFAPRLHEVTVPTLQGAGAKEYQLAGRVEILEITAGPTGGVVGHSAVNVHRDGHTGLQGDMPVVEDVRAEFETAARPDVVCRAVHRPTVVEPHLLNRARRIHNAAGRAAASADPAALALGETEQTDAGVDNGDAVRHLEVAPHIPDGHGAAGGVAIVADPEISTEGPGAAADAQYARRDGRDRTPLRAHYHVAGAAVDEAVANAATRPVEFTVSYCEDAGAGKLDVPVDQTLLPIACAGLLGSLESGGPTANWP